MARESAWELVAALVAQWVLVLETGAPELEAWVRRAQSRSINVQCTGRLGWFGWPPTWSYAPQARSIAELAGMRPRQVELGKK